MAVIEGGNDTANIQNVDSNFNAQVNLPYTLPAGTDQGGGTSAAGFAAALSEVDSGSVTGTRNVKAFEASADYRERVGLDSIVFNEVFPSAAINSAIWTAPVTTMTLTSAGGFATLNAGLSTASAAVARLSSYRHFPIYMAYETYCELDVQFSQVPTANNVCEWGLGIATGTAAPTDGAFFRINASGEFRCVINNNGTEIQSDTLNFATLVSTGVTKDFVIAAFERSVKFWINNVLVAEVDRGNSASSTTHSNLLPILVRCYNSGVTSVAQTMKVGAAQVSFGDQATNKPWGHVIAGAGGSSSQGQTGGTMGSTALYTNSLAAGAGAAATNTTAALGSGLGGQFTVTPTLAVPTDGIISSFQVPVGTAALAGKTLYITGVKIQGMVTAALTGGPVYYAYSLAYGHTAVSLATSEAATTKAARRIPLGFETYVVTAAAGTLGSQNGVVMNFDTPIVVQQGEFIQVVAKNMGTVTTVGTITILVAFNGYFE
jgi:hypothetical protein